MVAIVLGGSYAGRTHHATSDLDVGLYYRETAPFDIEAIRAIATAVSEDGNATVTGFYEWGAWVNGGAWINTAAGKVDFLYRNLDQIERTIADAHQGITQHDYGQQPAYGFYSVIYLAETEICLPLWDPNGVIATLKKQVAVYPPALKAKLVNDHLWSAEFTLLHARTFAAQGDIYNTVGCLTRAAANLTQVLFALNERYFQRDKQVMQTISNFAVVPPDYAATLSQILAHPGATPAALSTSVDQFAELWAAVVQLAGSLYQPKFNV
ncbi:MAG: nucleotidyltransferase domain-containing protein, partial [Caldilineaceae bacterium]|nr:nucleotidyltransferase domain-containing protein [Caldilineaceae bacterium]